jgi:hypothetical protein
VSAVRLAAALLTIGALLAMCGCYGSTEPATDVAFDHATLNGRGTTDNGPADVLFQIWPTAQPGQQGVSNPDSVPGGVTGPVSQPNSPWGPYGLNPETDYSFRLCAYEGNAQTPSCAQTRTFRTRKPTGDLLRGVIWTQFTGQGHTGNVWAESDRGGGGAAGLLEIPGNPGEMFTGNVTCLSVHRHDAAVGGLGTMQNGTPASGLLQVRDDPTPGFVNAGADKVQWTVTPNGGAPNCASAAFDDLHAPLVAIFTTYDTP